ncbi:MAG: glycosyltransferase [Rhodocyclaceae bacterium]|nr:glycosyltransferase [Rhodocyclaceae bacterium]
MHIVHTESSLGWGGQEIRILTEARGLMERGHQVRLLCPDKAQIFRAASDYGVPVVALPIYKKRLPDFFPLRQWLAENRTGIDVVNTHSSTDSWLAALACRTLANPPPIVRTRHLSTPVNGSRGTRWLYEKACAHVVVTGEKLKEQLVDQNRFPADHLTSIPTGIDTDRFQPRGRLAARAYLGLDPEAIYVGILATLRDWKGHTILFEALAALGARWPRLRLLVIGDGPYRDRLDIRAESLGVTERIDFVGHRLDAERWLNALDVFTLPSWGDEGVSQALMQAMASALPIVTTPVGSLTEVIHDGETGLIVPPRDGAALAVAIERLLTDAGLAQRLGDAARALAVERCGVERMLDRMEEIFRRYGRPGSV